VAQGVDPEFKSQYCKRRRRDTFTNKDNLDGSGMCNGFIGRRKRSRMKWAIKERTDDWRLTGSALVTWNRLLS
jgi:hypothetical protein